MRDTNLKGYFKKYRLETLERFWKRVRKTSTCWLWKGAISGRGYGVFSNSHIRIYAHRLSYFIKNGRLCRDLLVCHICDNPPCINPKHLFQTDQLGNLEDCRAKGRHAHGKTHGSKTKPECFARGERIAQHKLSSSDVIKIRKMYKSGKYSQYELGRMFGVNKRYTWLIINRKTWKHI